MQRPLDVTLTAVYYAGFSALLIGVILEQVVTGAIHERWTDAFFPVAFCLLMALLPGVIALGLWTLDAAARIAGVVFAALHLVLTVGYLQRVAGAHPLPWIRIAVDAVMIFGLLRPGVRRAFRAENGEMRLGLR